MKKTNNSTSIWCQKNQKEVLTYKTWVSMHLICKWFATLNGRKPVVFVPKFYCHDMIFKISNDAEFVYYEIKEDFVPDYKNCKELVKEGRSDIFVFVHYFGMELDANDARVFCKNNNCILIEDAVHVLWSAGRTGKFGDFVLYSPWEFLELPDGANLLINSDGPNKLDVESVFNEITILNEQLSEACKSIFKWKMKKFVQLMISDSNEKNADEITTLHIERAVKISKYAKKRLLNCSLKEILVLGDKKRFNALVIEDLLKKKYGISSLQVNGIPYSVPFFVGDDEGNNALSELEKMGYRWPVIDNNIGSIDRATSVKTALIHIPIHYGLNPNCIHKRVGIDAQRAKEYNLLIKEISKNDYDEAFQTAIVPIPLLQSSLYAGVKAETQGWRPKYWGVYDENKKVAQFLTLSKHSIIFRINRGPIILDPVYIDDIIRLIKDEFGSFGKLLFWAPELEQTGENINRFLSLKMRYRSSYYSTGYICLQEDEKCILSKMDSKWRNSLKSSMRIDFIIEQVEENSGFEQMLNLHIEDKKSRQYADSGDETTKKLFKSGKLKVLCVRNNEGVVISFIMIATHYRTATYYIGWSNEEGYRTNANRRLLWEALVRLKADGYLWFDMGGIDFIDTKGVADFKMGIGCHYLRLVGEYVASH